MPAPALDSPIDIVDELDRPVGTLERGKVLKEGKGFRVAHVWVSSGDALLLQQLGRNRERHPLRWGSSAAAYLHSGETYDEAAKRRLEEELGLQLPLDRFGVSKMQDGKSAKFVALYLARLPWAGLVEIQEPEHIEALRYWSRAEIERELGANPETFTETFRHLYGYYTSNTPIEAAH